MRLQLVSILFVFSMVAGLAGVKSAEKLTPPAESLSGLKPGTMTVSDLTEKYGKPSKEKGGLLKLYGGSSDSSLYGWFMVENPDYKVPDLAVETAAGSDKIDLVMSIGYAGFQTEKGLSCFASEDSLTDKYGKPDFVFAMQMSGFILREFYFVDLGISFDVAPAGQGGERQVIAIYVTYPEYLKRAIDLRKEYIKKGAGADITSQYTEGITA